MASSESVRAAAGSLRPKFRLGGPSHDGYSAALCPRPRHSLDHHAVLFCPARQRS